MIVEDVAGISVDAQELSLNDLRSIRSFADYVEANRSKVTMQGKTVSGKDAKTQRELDNLVKNLAATAPKFQDAQRRLRIVLTGS